MIDEEKRKSNAIFVNKYMSVIVGIISIYFCGYIGYVLEKNNVNDIIDGAMAVVNNLKELKFFYNPLSLNVVIGAGCGIGIGLLTYLILANETTRHYTADMTTSAGSGGFMTEKQFKEYKQKYIKPDPEPLLNTPVNVEEDYSKEVLKYSQNIIMTNKFCRPINSRALIGNNNLLVVGGAGTGKSRFLIKPNILQMNASFIVTDPSGEIINSTGKALSEHGYKIKIFNISDMVHSNTYNPLEYIRDEAGVNMLVTCLIENTTQGEVGGENQFFVDAEKLLYSACIFYLIDFCTDSTKKNFAGVIDLINSSQVDENNAYAKSPIDSLFEKLPQNSLAWKYYKAFKQAAGRTLKSIIISCVTRLQPFLTPQVRNLTSSDELELGNIGDEKTALFIITPQADQTYSFLASLLYSQLFETLYYKGESQLAAGGSEQMKIPVRCLMDEFANIGKVPFFPSKLSTMRKYNISATVVLQDLSQIESMYKDDWKNLVGNCSSILFLGSSEVNTLKYISEKLDKRTIRTKSTGQSRGTKSGSNMNYQYTGRDVKTISELSEMPPDECIIFTQNMKPFKDKKYRYENHPYYSCTADNDSKNAFNYKSMSIYNNSENNKFNSIIRAKNMIAKIREHKDEELETKKSGDANIAANNLKLDEAFENQLKNKMTKKCCELVGAFDEDALCVIKDTDTPSKFLPDVVMNVARKTNRNEIILFGGIESCSNSLIGIGYAANGDKRRLRKAMNNEYALNCEESVTNKSCILTMIKIADYKKYTEHIKNC